MDFKISKKDEALRAKGESGSPKMAPFTRPFSTILDPFQGILMSISIVSEGFYEVP